VRALDIFAGAGGFSLGAEQAGADVLFAINHWDMAAWTLRNNRPSARVVEQDAFEFNWHKAPDVDLVIASPACQGHSPAATKGGKGKRNAAPPHDADRATAWAVPRCLEIKRPKFAIVENVYAFANWAGYRGWRHYMEDVGYRLKSHRIECADMGVPSLRKRLFITAVRKDVSRKPFDLKVPRRRKAGFKKCLDKKLSRNREHWTPADSKVDSIRRKVRSGRRKIPRGMFLVNNVSEGLPIPVNDPIRTITTKAGGQWQLVRRGSRGEEVRLLTTGELLCAMGFSKKYALPEGKVVASKLIGNAVPPPVAREFVSQIIQRG
jgi:DNA (cytosine-5)-methyltransferase 1